LQGALLNSVADCSKPATRTASEVRSLLDDDVYAPGTGTESASFESRSAGISDAEGALLTSI
jgi:hypothetical protein